MSESEGARRELRASGGTPRRLGSEEKRQFAAQRAYLNTRPRFFSTVDNKKKPLKDRSEPGLPLRACSLHSWEFYPSSPAPAHKTKAFRSAGMLEPLGSPPPTHRSQIPQKTLGILHIQPGLLSDSPVWASAFSQHYFSTSLSGLNRLHYLRRHLTIFYHRAGTDQHRTGRGSPTEL